MDEIPWLANLCHVTLSQPLLQLLRQGYLPAQALQMTVRSLGQNVAALGTMEFHDAR